ncbi:MAG: aldo/keto reductase [Candidatus Eremiobacteraeota bacterium]|nr:aldo/keto reductase [Candidatus Eremiobacteraeota bacterium]
MSENPSLMSRRDFHRLMAGSISAAAFSAVWGRLSPHKAFADEELILEKRRMGNIGLKVTAVSFDASRLETTGWSPLQSALEKGINFIDTSPAYGKSEEIIGENLLNWRDKVMLSTRWLTDGKASPEDLMLSFERSMKRLRTKYIDAVIVHEVKKLDQLKCRGVQAAFNELRKQQKVGYLGLSLREYQEESGEESPEEIFRELFRMSGFDILILEYSVSNYKTLRSLAEKAGRKGIAVFASHVTEKNLSQPSLTKRLIAGKFGQDLFSASIKWVLTENGICSVLVPLESSEEVDKAVTAASVED